MIHTITEGEVDFNVPYGRRPLVILYGGTGSPSEHLFGITSIVSSHHIPVIVYDQLGGGRSTHLPEKNGDNTFWRMQLFLDELDNLLIRLGVQQNYSILGHGNGVYLASCHATLQRPGLKKLVIADPPGSGVSEKKIMDKVRAQLPMGVQDIMRRHEADDTVDCKEYEAAFAVYFQALKREPNITLIMTGPGECEVIITQKPWSIGRDALRIRASTMETTGWYLRLASVGGVAPPWEQRYPFAKDVGDFLEKL
ncbi:hypothetical protein MMC14_008557 [Varicellaria rhodocarpa]|nr:hypothetical protein [Varicellaria rhodocarpa]